MLPSVFEVLRSPHAQPSEMESIVWVCANDLVLAISRMCPHCDDGLVPIPNLSGRVLVNKSWKTGLTASLVGSLKLLGTNHESCCWEIIGNCTFALFATSKSRQVFVFKSNKFPRFPFIC